MVPAMRAVTGPGSVVARRYELLARIGQGATGTVWRARDLVLERDVAIKEVRLPELMSDRDREILRERTLREARVSAKLSHPAVVTVHDVIESGGTPWIVMELVAARSLHQVVAEDGPLPPERVAEMGMMLLGALASAHAAGIVHRDVKPGNVLVTRDGRAVLTDFGIATVAGDPALTQTGVVVGTPGFCAPERIRGAPASPASDLWSLGATLFAAVEGHGPFEGHGSPMAVLASIVHSDPPPARSAGPLGTVIGALLRKDPAQRPDAARASRLLADANGAAKARASTRGAAAAGGASAASGGQAAAGADAGLVSARAKAGLAPAGSSQVPAGAGRAGAAAVPVAASPVSVPVSAGPAAASARTDPLGFPFPPPPPAGGGAATAQLLADAGPDLLPPAPGTFPAGPGPFSPAGGAFSAAPGPFPPAAGPFSPAPAPDLFPRAAGLGSFPPHGGPALFAARAGLAAPAEAGSSPLPVSMGAASLPDGTAAGAGPADRAGAPSSPGRRWLVLGLASAAIVVAGLAAGLVWSRATAPAADSARSAGGGAPTATAPLPAGYHWYTWRAATGKARGFTLAVPAGWQPRRQGTATYLWNPASGAIISVSPAPAAAGSPTWQTRVLNRAGLGQGAFASYRRIAGAHFLSHGRLAGAWRFTYRQTGTGAVDGLVVVTQASAAGGGSFELTATAPARYWLGTEIAFAQAVRTFSPGALS
jgi:eukaryotic-like serine/threonine-protein kinase